MNTGLWICESCNASPQMALTERHRYWDNVGGPVLDAALLNFNDYGLVIVCTTLAFIFHSRSRLFRPVVTSVPPPRKIHLL